MKRIALMLAAIFALFCLTTLSSCRERAVFPENYISLTMSISKDGTVRQEIDFSMQTQKLKDLGVKPELILQVKNNFLSNLNALRNEFYLSFLLVYSKSPDARFEIGKSVVVSDVYCQSDLDNAGFVIAYKDVTTYQYFQGAKIPENDDQQTNEQLLGKNIKFLTKQTVEGANPFAAKYVDKVGNQSNVGQRYLAIYKNCFNMTLASQICDRLETPKFVYDYATPYSNIRSNADIQMNGGGLYHNVWICDEDCLDACKIKLSSTVVNTGLWYLTLLVCLIAIFAIVMIFAKVFERKKQKPKLRLPEK